MLEPRCDADSAHISEIFSAIQGEGILVGERQVFVRFTECHIACNYCDTPDQDPDKVSPVAERTAGLRDWETLDKPVSRAKIADCVLRLHSQPTLHKWVSFTGGEPLWYWPMVGALAPAFREAGLKIYLETNGLLADELAEVARHIDLVAMDVKLDPRGHGFLDRERTLAFLRLARAQTRVFLKVVIPARLETDAFLEVVSALADETDGEQLVLQPVTPYGVVTESPSPDQMLWLQESVSRVYPACRVVPQVHKLIGQR